MAEMDRALDECLSALHDGRALQDVLRRYPGRREDLIALLQLSLDLQQVRPPAPETVFRLRARNRMLAAAQRGRSLPRAPFTLVRRLRPVLVGMAGVAAAAALSYGGLTTAAAGSLPGEPLYTVKTAAEGIQLRLTLDPAANTHLQFRFAQRRLDEAQRLARLGRVPEAVRLVDVYATVLSADASDREAAAGQQAADEQLRRLAGDLSAAGDSQAASSVDRARTHLDEEMAKRNSQPGRARDGGRTDRSEQGAGTRQP